MQFSVFKSHNINITGTGPHQCKYQEKKSKYTSTPASREYKINVGRQAGLVKSFDKWVWWGGSVTIEAVKVYYHGRRVELLSRHKLELIETLMLNVNMINFSTYCHPENQSKRGQSAGQKIILKFHAAIQSLAWHGSDSLIIFPILLNYL